MVGPPGVVAPSSPGSPAGRGGVGSLAAVSGSVRVSVAAAGASLLTEVSMLFILSRRCWPRMSRPGQHAQCNDELVEAGKLPTSIGR